ncbi:MAG: LURP-one-related family protein [Peptoniphilaceae bacterium]|nr:LURP-one-related family protein [Peptoniphilaceae bacterium]
MKNYYFKEKIFKITDHYAILDDDGNTAYYVDQDFKLLGYKSTISDKNKKLILTIDKEIFSLFQKFNVNFIDGKYMRVESRLSFFTRKIDIDYNGEDLTLRGKLLDLNFEIFKDNNLIAEIEKTFFAMTDTYMLTVHDENYTEALLGLTLCLNNIKDTNNSRANN